MSLSGQRQEAVDLLNTIPGVHAETHRPVLLSRGSAWPLLGQMQAATGIVPGFAAIWRVVVVQPPDERDASDWFDAEHEAIADVLQEFGHVESIEPTAVATDAGDMYAMILTVRREG